MIMVGAMRTIIIARRRGRRRSGADESLESHFAGALANLGRLYPCCWLGRAVWDLLHEVLHDVPGLHGRKA